MKKSILNLALVSMLILPGSIALAVSTNAYSGVGNYDAGLIDNTNFLEMRQYETKQKYQETKNPQIIEEEARQKMELEKTQQVRFTLKDVVIEKNTVFSTRDLIKLVDYRIGKQVTINDLIESANEITDYYQSRGYLSTIAYLPPQKVQNGVITIVVLEGKYGKIDVKGNKWAKATYVNKAYLADNNISEENVLNVNDMKRALQGINSSDYMKGSVELTDNEESEEYSDVTLNVKDRFPINLDLRYDNQGRDLIGRQRGVLYAGMYNVTGHGDNLLGTASFSSRSVGAGALYSIPIAKNETKLNIGYSYSNVRLGKQYKDLDITGQSNDFFVGVSRRLAKGSDYRLYGDLTFDMRDSRTDYGFVDYADKYRTRVLRGTLTDVKDDFYGKWLLSSAVGVGVPLLNASDDQTNNAYASNNFVKLNANVARMQILPKNCLAIFQLNGQYASRALFPSEKMQFGGIASVRGFDEGFFIGDYGLTSSLELRSPIPGLRHILPDKYKFVDDSIKIAGFYDFGFLGNRFSGEDPTQLMSIGPGVVVKLTKYLSGNVYWGFPIGNRPDDCANSRFHFTLTSNVL